MNPDLALDPALEGRSVTRTALFAALGRVPLWSLTAGATLLLAVFVAWPWHGWFEGALAHRYAPGEELRSLDSNFTQDHDAALGVLKASTRTLGGWMALLAILANVFFAGGWLQVFLERTEGHSVQRFFLGGARYFFRFLRVLILTVVLLSILDYLVFGRPWEHFVWGKLYGVVDGDLETLGDERTAVRLEWMRQAVHLALFTLVLTWATYTRTRLALHETRSALVAGIGTFFTMLTHPIRTVRPMLLLKLVEVAVLALGALSIHWLQGGLAEGSGVLRVLLLGLAGLLPVVFGCIVRGACYSAAVQVSRDVIAPLSAPDPWSRRVGGPGGPQYPLAEEDEYGISL